RRRNAPGRPCPAHLPDPAALGGARRFSVPAGEPADRRDRRGRRHARPASDSPGWALVGVRKRRRGQSPDAGVLLELARGGGLPRDARVLSDAAAKPRLDIVIRNEIICTRRPPPDASLVQRIEVSGSTPSSPVHAANHWSTSLCSGIPWARRCTISSASDSPG